MKGSSKRNHFDVITSKCRPVRHHCVGHVFLSLFNRRQLRSYVHDHFPPCCNKIATLRAVHSTRLNQNFMYYLATVSSSGEVLSSKTLTQGWFTIARSIIHDIYCLKLWYVALLCKQAKIWVSTASSLDYNITSYLQKCVHNLAKSMLDLQCMVLSNTQC